MKLPKRTEKGFTLVELLIVLAILAVLAAVVIPNVTGMLGRGQKQSYETDAKTIQSAAAAFIIDIRDAGTPANSGHYVPMGDSYPGTLQTSKTLLYKFTIGSSASDIEFDDAYYVTGATMADGSAISGTLTEAIADAAIQMNWLFAKMDNTYTPAPSTTPAASVWDDAGPYLDKMPESAGSDNQNTTEPGSYTWVVDYSGAVYCMYYDVDHTTWLTGYADTYP